MRLKRYGVRDWTTCIDDIWHFRTNVKNESPLKNQKPTIMDQCVSTLTQNVTMKKYYWFWLNTIQIGISKNITKKTQEIDYNTTIPIIILLLTNKFI